MRHLTVLCDNCAVRRKPSMFSKNYHRQLKRRRQKNIIMSVIIILALGAGIWIVALKNEVFFSNKSPSSNINEEERKNENKSGDEITQEPNKPQTVKREFVNTLESGKNIKVIYEEQDEIKNINEIICDEKVKYNLSPSKERILLIDESTKDIYLMDLNNNLTKITNPAYIATDKTTYKKEDVLKRNKEYIWVEEAAFIDDSHIAYSSALPWINKSNTKYLWIYDSDKGSHKGYYSIKGNEFKFEDITSKGLGILLDGKKIYIDNSGKIIS